MQPNDIAKLVLEKFEKLKIKLPKEEWTVLAAMLLEIDDELEVVSLATGLKCLPLCEYEAFPLTDQLVHDCHAEILSRRAFKLFVINEIRLSEMEGFSSKYIERIEDHKFRLRTTVKIHMYISHAPCGDASMHSFPDDDPIHTAAKCMKYSDEADGLRRGRDDFSATPGALRTKPGRSDAPKSICMSCSDKMTSWTYLGVQGAALMYLLSEPIYINSVVVGDHFDFEALDRALNRRTRDCVEFSSFKRHPIEVAYTDFLFMHRQEAGRKASSEAFVWYKGCKITETIVKGRRKGSGPPKNNELSLKCQSSMSRNRIFLAMKNFTPFPFDSYYELKASQTEYKEAKNKLFSLDSFKGWLRLNKKEH